MIDFLQRLIAVVLLGVMLACCVSCGGAAADDALRMSFIDVGKGDCILIQKDGHSVLIDAGYANTADKVLAFLKKAGVEKLDVLVITHYDKDHVGGAAAILQSLPVDKLYLPGYEPATEQYTSFMAALSQLDIPAERVTADVTFRVSDAVCTIYASKLAYYIEDGESEGNDNDVSLVITVTCGQDSYLLAGDIEEAGIESFLAAGLGTFDVVKMPHHGRKESNTDDFVDSVQPKIAVVTDSADDSIDKKVTKHLTAIEADIYSSSVNGNIEIKSTGAGEYTVTTQK